MNDSIPSDRRKLVTQSRSGADHNRGLGRDTPVQEDGTMFPTLDEGITLLDLAGDRGVVPLQSLVVDHLLLNNGTVFWIDVHGYATTIQFSRIAPSRQLLDRVQVARGFTPFQHYSVVCDLPDAIDDHSDEMALIVTPALDIHYRDQDALPAEHSQTLQIRVLARLRRYSDHLRLLASTASRPCQTGRVADRRCATSDRSNSAGATGRTPTRRSITMGRTNPTYRDLLGSLEERWADFRRALRTRNQPHFDQLFCYAREHADASGLLNHHEPLLPALFSIDLEQEHRLDNDGDGQVCESLS